MNSKTFFMAALGAILIPAFASGQTGTIEGPKPVPIFGAPYVAAAAQQFPLTGSMENDLAFVPAGQDEKNDQQTVLQTGRKKNPIVGGLLSLAVPGAGQVYSGSYTRAAIYILAEAAAITAGIVYNNKGDRKTDEFQAYADAHWSPVRYAQFLNHYAAQYRHDRDNANIQISSDMSLPSWQRVDFNAINAYESGAWDYGFSHRLPKHGEQQYYELIGKYDQFKYGWDQYPHDGEIPADDNHNYMSVPQQLVDYAAERGKANDFYTTSRLAVSLLVVNHVVSAIDGYLAARHYNAELTSGMSLERVGDRMAATSRITLSVGI